MCSTPKTQAPTAPTQYAAARSPNRADTEGAGQRMSDRLRSGTQTILTGPMGVTQGADTGKKTLLGA